MPKQTLLLIPFRNSGRENRRDRSRYGKKIVLIPFRNSGRENSTNYDNITTTTVLIPFRNSGRENAGALTIDPTGKS